MLVSANSPAADKDSAALDLLALTHALRPLELPPPAARCVAKLVRAVETLDDHDLETALALIPGWRGRMRLRRRNAVITQLALEMSRRMPDAPLARRLSAIRTEVGKRESRRKHGAPARDAIERHADTILRAGGLPGARRLRDILKSPNAVEEPSRLHEAPDI